MSSAVAMGNVAVVMYSTSWCGYCEQARQLLRSKGVAFEELDVDAQPQRREEMFERSREYTVPQIFIGRHHVGGAEELQALEAAGGLDAMLAGS